MASLRAGSRKTSSVVLLGMLCAGAVLLLSGSQEDFVPTAGPMLRGCERDVSLNAVKEDQEKKTETGFSLPGLPERKPDFKILNDMARALVAQIARCNRDVRCDSNRTPPNR